jgi:hypothetical protein
MKYSQYLETGVFIVMFVEVVGGLFCGVASLGTVLPRSTKHQKARIVPDIQLP